MIWITSRYSQRVFAKESALPALFRTKTADGREYSAETPMPTHSEAFEAVVYALTKSDAKVIDSFDEISAIGHRIVQGGAFSRTAAL